MIIGALLAGLLLAPPTASKAGVTAPPAVIGDIDTDINAVTADFIAKVIREAESSGAPFVVLRLNTPGGRLDSTREIAQTILSSKVPVVGYVTPPGAQAASAGFLILMACDVAVMAPGTNAGAASPVGGSGEDLPKTISKKVTEDASALLRSLTSPRGRPAAPAVLTITEAISYSETECKEKQLIELVARDLPDLFRQLDGRPIKRVGKADASLKSNGASFTVKRMTALQKALGVIANPALAGILFLIGMVGLYAEMSHPGAVLPGVLGGICLLLALFAMSVLPTNYAGIGLMLLGVLFFFLEVKLASHGLFAIGGGAAIILGAVLLFHDNDLAPKGDFWFIVAGAATTSLILALLSLKALSMQSLPDRTGAGVLLGQVVAARTDIHGTGKIFADGAIWEARSATPVPAGDLVEIVSLDGLSVIVRPRQTPGARG
ncbi:MAG: nodulation protein NfeD [Thermoanaerobaculia bacterium]